MEHAVRIAGGTADIETEQLLIIKRSVRPSAFCNYKCINISLFPNSAVYFAFFIITRLISYMLTVVFISILQNKLVF